MKKEDLLKLWIISLNNKRNISFNEDDSKSIISLSAITNKEKDENIEKEKEIIKERIDWLKTLEGINLENENFHEKEWELNKLNEKIIQLQQSLCQSNIALNNERRRIISFNSEIDTFKSKFLFLFNIYFYSKIKKWRKFAKIGWNRKKSRN